MPARSELASALRAWRDRLRPEEVGLPGGGRRRATGLRREELAGLADISVDYLTQLEQGRTDNPSPQVLSALAVALRLSADERDMLYIAAGVAKPSPTVVPRHISPGVQRILDRLTDTPVAVFTASWDDILANPMWRALFGDCGERSGRDRNLVWRLFMSDRSLIARIPEEHDTFRRTMVSDLHDTAVRYPEDRDLAAMIRDLRTMSTSFAGLWDSYTVSRQLSARKTIVSPAVGPIVLDCDILAAIDADLRIVVYTARPGTEDAGKLDQLCPTRGPARSAVGDDEDATER